VVVVALVDLAAELVVAVVLAVAGNANTVKKIIQIISVKNNHMKKSIIVVALFAAAFTTSAQAPKMPAGTKFKVVTESNNITSMSMMGQDIELSNGNKSYADFHLKSVSASGYQLSTSITRISGSVSAMGNEQTFDSEDASLKSNPMLAEQLKMLNKPIDFTIENGKVVNTASAAGSDVLTALLGQSNGTTDQAKYFLTLPAASIKPAHQWSVVDNKPDASSESLYVIAEVTATDISVNVLTNVKLYTTLNQNGMEIKQNTQGTIKAKRVYDAKTGLLKSETASGGLKGTMNVMGQDAPIDLKITSKSSVVPM
jgi:hypothetical protein